MKKLFLVGIMSLFVTGCMSQKIILKDNGVGVEKPKMAIFFVGGVAQTESINVKDVCGNPTAVESKNEALDIVIKWFTSPIFTPRTSKVYCK